ncbi:hypothetical protein CONPUDRAFT_85387 [Coniophora puteana RWD-64-598 SS2]|uniref:Uncharacterized protein n=1 Tax=Coniophora puteana (strain RWD-64-598) TaxID=741705 RepID=A0A5M3M8V5_CONPW|nr:uncharacterized protein CONPUDRAFT_85387 [Coniophora puteana RWD-64-598 SS2]EIW75702.1 hypothetical protein CONPUDRAFT_85387 [Coniophora puteana RWD-64-598 SS2]
MRSFITFAVLCASFVAAVPLPQLGGATDSLSSVQQELGETLAGLDGNMNLRRAPQLGGVTDGLSGLEQSAGQILAGLDGNLPLRRDSALGGLPGSAGQEVNVSPSELNEAGEIVHALQGAASLNGLGARQDPVSDTLGGLLGKLNLRQLDVLGGVPQEVTGVLGGLPAQSKDVSL